MQRKIIKISTPYNYTTYQNQISPALNDKFSFEIDNDCDKCDYWVVLGDLPERSDSMSVRCPREHIFFVTDEAYVEKKFDQRFLDQFSHVITCRSDIAHRGLIRTHEMLVWQLRESYDFFSKLNIPEKTKNISLVCSNKLFLPGHVKRYAFANKLMGHFKDKIDFLGSGFTRIEDKLSALMPYKYSIAIENSYLDDYFTEKLTECYLTCTYPIYYGAPNINKYFDEGSLTQIDREDFIGSVRKIEELLESDPWGEKTGLLLAQKQRFLERYHFYPALTKVLVDHTRPDAKFTKNKLNSMRSFQGYYRIKKSLYHLRNLLRQ